MAQKHNISCIEKPMTVATTEQGPQKRYRRLRFPSFDADVWAEKNPLLQKGELGHEKDTGRFKVGDGVTYWADLPYNSVGESAKINGYNVLEIIAGENVEIRQDGNVLIIDVAIGSIKNDLDDLGDQVSGIEEKIPESASGSNPLITKQQLQEEETDIRKDLNSGLNELQTQITAQAAEIAIKQDQLVAGDNIVISGNTISATGTGGVGFDMQVVDQLPATGEKGVIYLVPKDGAAPDVHDEYIWIDATQTFELIGTTQVDLSSYVKNTDYATSVKAGILTPSSYYATAMSGQYFYAITKTLDAYKDGVNGMFIGKGTLENIKDDYVKRGITENALTFTDDEKAKARTLIGASRVIIRKWS